MNFSGGAGSSNTGNISKILLENAEKIHEIIGVPVELIKALHTLLIMMSCPYVMYPDQFGEYCQYVDKLMRDFVDWHPSIPRDQSFTSLMADLHQDINRFFF